MTWAAAQAVARALLYEGYLLYPYRQSGLKNQKRWAFGTLYPPSHAASARERSALCTEVLVRGETPTVRAALSFLQWVERSDPGRTPWREALERIVETRPISVTTAVRGPSTVRFGLTGDAWERDDRRYVSAPVEGWLSIEVERLDELLSKVRITAANTFASPHDLSADEAEMHSLASAHVLLRCEGGAFVSLLDPPDDLAYAARSCRHEGVWPVLIGDAPKGDLMLASPIHVYDYPVVAPESGGDFYDATEIDEMLALRVETLTEAEKREARQTDPRAAALLDRCEAMTEAERLALHGARRDPGADLRPGDRVRLHPRSGRDLFDIALAGETATVVSTEEDFEGRRYCTVTVDADPGRDLGESGQPGHRFFFDLDELERLS
jgi:hypothetical protein